MKILVFLSGVNNEDGITKLQLFHEIKLRFSRYRLYVLH